MRYAVAIGVVAVTLAAAVYVHERKVTVGNPLVSTSGHSVYLGGTSAAHRVRPSWEDPVAVLLALGGLAIAVGIVTVGRRN